MTSELDFPFRESSKPISRGAFIVIEGLDRSGKTTQVKKLCEALYASGRNVRAIRFPDRSTPIGTMIDSYLQSKTPMDDHSIHLLFSANRWERASYISQSIAEGYTVVCDRYSYSGAIYSAAKLNPLLPFGWAHAPEVGLPKPDLVVFLDLSPENTAKRGGYGEEKYEKREMQEWVRSFYVTMGAFQTAPEGEEEMVIVPAGKEIDEVAKDVLAKVLPRVERFEGPDRVTADVQRIEARNPSGEKNFMQNVKMMHETLGYGGKSQTIEDIEP